MSNVHTFGQLYCYNKMCVKCVKCVKERKGAYHAIVMCAQYGEICLPVI